MKVALKGLLIAAGVMTAAVVFGYALVTMTNADEAASKAHTAYMEHYRATDPDVLACRARGALPVFSNWDGSIIDCKPLPAKQ